MTPKLKITPRFAACPTRERIGTLVKTEGNALGVSMCGVEIKGQRRLKSYFDLGKLEIPVLVLVLRNKFQRKSLNTIIYLGSDARKPRLGSENKTGKRKHPVGYTLSNKLSMYRQLDLHAETQSTACTSEWSPLNGKDTGECTNNS